jgi:ornithine lipid ester-linked acyl 2-hydroxylase
MPHEAPYFRIFGDYTATQPIFYRRDECPWLSEIESQWRVIREEFEDYHYRRGQALKRSFIPDDVAPQSWRSINFVTYQHWYHENCALMPKTAAILRGIPFLTSAFINLLEPHSVLQPHNGDTNTTYRCHLGLIIPGAIDQCGLEVGGERTGWQEGRAFAFNEAPWHHVWNHTPNDRVVMVFDVMRPEYRPQMLRICGDVLGAMTLTTLETKLPFLRGLPNRLRHTMHRMLGIAAGVYLRLHDGVH